MIAPAIKAVPPLEPLPHALTVVQHWFSIAAKLIAIGKYFAPKGIETEVQHIPLSSVCEVLTHHLTGGGGLSRGRLCSKRPLTRLLSSLSCRNKKGSPPGGILCTW